jgi:hypothetical protein
VIFLWGEIQSVRNVFAENEQIQIWIQTDSVLKFSRGEIQHAEFLPGRNATSAHFSWGEMPQVWNSPQEKWDIPALRQLHIAPGEVSTCFIPPGEKFAHFGFVPAKNKTNVRMFPSGGTTLLEIRIYCVWDSDSGVSQMLLCIPRAPRKNPHMLDFPLRGNPINVPWNACCEKHARIEFHSYDFSTGFLIHDFSSALEHPAGADFS